MTTMKNVLMAFVMGALLVQADVDRSDTVLAQVDWGPSGGSSGSSGSGGSGSGNAQGMTVGWGPSGGVEQPKLPVPQRDGSANAPVPGAPVPGTQMLVDWGPSGKKKDTTGKSQGMTKWGGGGGSGGGDGSDNSGSGDQATADAQLLAQVDWGPKKAITPPTTPSNDDNGGTQSMAVEWDQNKKKGKKPSGSSAAVTAALTPAVLLS